MSWLELEPTICRNRDNQANHYIADVVEIDCSVKSYPVLVGNRFLLKNVFFKFHSSSIFSILLICSSQWYWTDSHFRIKVWRQMERSSIPLKLVQVFDQSFLWWLILQKLIKKIIQVFFDGWHCLKIEKKLCPSFLWYRFWWTTLIVLTGLNTPRNLCHINV